VLFLSWQVGTNEARAWQLEQDRRAAEQLEQLKTNFVSMMSHDLKTPIAKIQSICDRLMSQAESERMAEDLRNLRRSSDELHRYIRSILQVSKIEAREMAILREPVDLNEVLFRVIGRLKPLAQEKGLTLDSDFEPLFSIEADSTLLEEIAHNLVENAIKYTPAGGTVTIASSEIGNDVVVT
jgi:signal transduction histidine kinase